MKAQPFQYHGREVMTLRQLDELNDVPKGTSFRAFKRVRPYLEDGKDFFCLAADEQLQLLVALRQCALVYPASVSIVLVTRSGYQRMQEGR